MFDVKVINKYKEKYDIYGGRGSPLGNPFIEGIDGDRDDVCNKYEKYFLWRIEWDNIFKNYVLNLHGKIACSCKPKRCHLDFVVKWLEKNKQ